MASALPVLPFDVKLKILQFLDYHEIITTGRVDKGFYVASKNGSLWIPHIRLAIEDLANARAQKMLGQHLAMVHYMSTLHLNETGAVTQTTPELNLVFLSYKADFSSRCFVLDQMSHADGGIMSLLSSTTLPENECRYIICAFGDKRPFKFIFWCPPQFKGLPETELGGRRHKFWSIQYDLIKQRLDSGSFMDVGSVADLVKNLQEDLTPAMQQVLRSNSLM